VHLEGKKVQANDDYCSFITVHEFRDALRVLNIFFSANNPGRFMRGLDFRFMRNLQLAVMNINKNSDFMIAQRASIRDLSNSRSNK
jgi:hypothetical protein